MICGMAFDFDGTLVLSNEIKRHGFFVVVADFPSDREVIEGLLANPPSDRFVIFSAFAKRYAVDSHTLKSRYSEWLEEQTLYCPERVWAAALLSTLKCNHVTVHVISATPLAPLPTIFERRYPPDTFDGVFGGHGAKIRNLRVVLSDAGLEPQEMQMVGDGIDDYRTVLAVGCAFEGVTDGTLAEATLSVPLLSGLTTLRRYFPE